MKNNSRLLLFRIIIFSLTALTIAFIFVHSSMPAVKSADESESVLGFMQTILGFFGLGEGLTDLIVRKIAHFAEFSVLGIMLELCVYSLNRVSPHKYLPHVLGAGLLTAVIDETIQLGSPGRAGRITDVWLDFSGVIFGSLVMLAIFALYIHIRRNKNGRV